MSDTEATPFHPGINEKGGLCAAGATLIDRIEHFADEDEPPKRAFRLAIDLSADSEAEVDDALNEIVAAIRRGARAATSGSVGHGYHFELERRDVSHDEFVASFYAWREGRR